MTTSAPTIGFARLPKVVRALLSEAARAATSAATALRTLARDTTQHAALEEIVSLEDDGDRIVHELQHTLAGARLGSQERCELLHVIEANCGSVGKPRDGDPRGAFAVLDLDDAGHVHARIERVAYDTEAVAHEVAAAGLPPEYADKLLAAA
jgi:hypothetical protein